MTKRITARKAYQASTRLNVFEIAAEKAAADQIRETVKLVKILRGRGKQFSTAAKIAKRAYRMGIRSVFAN